MREKLRMGPGMLVKPELAAGRTEVEKERPVPPAARKLLR